jgi:hypothetical protein
MAKKEIRKILASEDVASIIDQGSEIDTELKNLTYKDKGFKSQITKAAEGMIDLGESSIRLEGNTASVVVTASEKLSLDTGAEGASQVHEAAEQGILNDVIKVSKAIRIPPEFLDQAVALLNNAGIKATITKSYALNTPAYREFSDEGSPEAAAVKGILDQCIETKTTYRVKYER